MNSLCTEFLSTQEEPRDWPCWVQGVSWENKGYKHAPAPGHTNVTRTIKTEARRGFGPSEGPDTLTAQPEAEWNNQTGQKLQGGAVRAVHGKGSPFTVSVMVRWVTLEAAVPHASSPAGRCGTVGVARRLATHLLLHARLQ